MIPNASQKAANFRSAPTPVSVGARENHEPEAKGQEGPSDAAQCLRNLRARLGGLSLPGGSEGIAAALPALSSSINQLMVEHQGMADELLCLYEQLGIVFEITRKLAGVKHESDVLDLFLVSLRRSFAERAVIVARRLPWGWVLESKVEEASAPSYEPTEGQTSRPMREGPGGSTPLSAGAKHPSDASTPATVSPKTRESWGEQTTTTVGARAQPQPAVHDWLRARLDRAANAGGPGVIVEPVPRGTMPGAVAEVMIAPVISGDTLDCCVVLLRSQPSPVFRASEMMLIESLTTFCGDLIRSHRLVRELREMSIAMVRALVNAVDQKDEYTSGHSLRVAYYATTLGQRLGLGEFHLQMLQWAALLHDVGKIGIRDDVLKKEGKLTPEEFGHIKEHPVRSHKVVQQVPQLRQALDGILHHHERYDGSGYPAGLKGEQIPLQARIIQIADVFDALTSNRSYRKAFDWQRALGILEEEAGKSSDPRLQKTFDTLIRETLQDDPQAWERMVERAGRFMVVECSPHDSRVVVLTQGLDATASESGSAAAPVRAVARPQGE